jgi:hypothetical protein
MFVGKEGNISDIGDCWLLPTTIYFTAISVTPSIIGTDKEEFLIFEATPRIQSVQKH